MKALKYQIIFLVFLKFIFAQNIPVEIDSVKLPNHRIVFFDHTLLPSLTDAQKAKYAILKLQKEISEIEEDIKSKLEVIAKKKNNISLVIEYYKKEKTVFSSVLLGLYSEETKTKKDSVIFDEKSILWGAFKWGKKKKEIEDEAE